MFSAVRHAAVIGCLIATTLHAQRANPSVHCAAVADFVVLGGRDTIGVSRVTLTDSAFESTDRAVSQHALLHYKGRRSSTGDIASLHLEAWHDIADSAGPPTQIADVTVQGGDVSARVAAPSRGVQMQHDRLPSDGVLYMTSVPLFMELLQRHVRLAVGATTTVAALWLFTGGAVDTVRVARPAADSLTLHFGDMDYAIALAADHSILSVVGRSPKGGADEPTRMIRRDCK